MEKTQLTPHEFQALYENVKCPGDPSRFNHYVQSAWIKFQIARLLQPSNIVELGVRAGYSAWSLHHGWPIANIIAYDSYQSGYQGTQGHELELQVHAEELLERLGIELRIEDTQKLKSIPSAALYHVDADHTYEGCYKDIKLCMNSNDEAVIVVHDSNADAVHSAIKDVVTSANPRWFWDNISSHWGDAVISRRLEPWVDKVKPFPPKLVKSDPGWPDE